MEGRMPGPRESSPTFWPGLGIGVVAVGLVVLFFFF